MTAISHDPKSTPLHQPRVSIVVAADGCRKAVDVLVEVVQRHPSRSSLEVLVVSPASHRLTSDNGTDHPFVRYVVAPIGSKPGELRANGIRHASGDVVILLDGDREINAAMVDRLLAPTIRGDSD
jgi:hypothetical protein